MKMFLDTSSLFKKFVTENGSDKILKLLEQANSLIIAPTAWLEVNSIVHRLARQKSIPKNHAEELLQTIENDLKSFESIIWDSVLEKRALEMIRKHQLRSLDSIQLASACLAKADLFVTSDEFLYKKAQKELAAHFIG